MNAVRYVAIFFCALFVVPMVSYAQDEETSVVADDVTYDERVALAEKIHEYRPVRDQVDDAIARYAQTQPPQEQEAFKTAMRNVLNVRALEKISIDAYAEVFTVEELRAMEEYYAKPEAQSASDKLMDYSEIVYPEIMRMLDKAAMRVKTGQ